jgi:hypothetical protein
VSAVRRGLWAGGSADSVFSAWADDLARFRADRVKYLLY